MESASNNHVGVFDAKTNLSQLIDRVELGETIVITRHGMPVARLVPYEDAVGREQVREAVDGLLGFKGPKLPKGLTIKKLIDEGRS
jgi:prevent-host-death family protein